MNIRNDVRNDVRNERWERKKGLSLLKLDGACATTRETLANLEGNPETAKLLQQGRQRLTIETVTLSQGTG